MTRSRGDPQMRKPYASIVVLLVVLLLQLMGQAGAQPSPPTPPPISTKGGNASLSATGASSNVALPSSTLTFPVVQLVNVGTTEIFYNLGVGAGTAATTASASLPPNGSIALFAGANTFVAAITGGGTSTVRVTQWNGAPSYANTGGGGGGGGTVSPATLGQVGVYTAASVIGGFTGFTYTDPGLVTLTHSAIGATSTDGIVLQNLTAAAAGVQQKSPRIHLTGAGWATTGPTSKTQEWTIEVAPLQSTTGTSDLVFSTQLAGGGYQAMMTYELNPSGAQYYYNGGTNVFSNTAFFIFTSPGAVGFLSGANDNNIFFQDVPGGNIIVLTYGSPVIGGWQSPTLWKFDNATDATSTTAAAIMLAGGLGVVKALRVGGLANIAGTLTNPGIVATAQADVVCTTSAGLFTFQVSATGCAASSERFKNMRAPLSRDEVVRVALGLAQARRWTYKNPEQFGDFSEYAGFTAEQVAAVDDRFITRDDEGRPYAVKHQQLAEASIAGFALVIGDMRAEIDDLRAQVRSRSHAPGGLRQ